MGSRGMALPKKAKRLPRPAHRSGVRHALAVPTQTGGARLWRGADAHTSHRSWQRADAAGAGRFAAGDAAAPAPAGTHLAAHLAVAPPVRHAVPGAAGTLCRAGPAVPRLGGA